MIFLKFGWFGEGFARILEGFFDDFSRFCRQRRNGVEGHETLRGRMKFAGRLLKKTRNFCKKAAKSRCKFAMRKKTSKKPFKIRFGNVLGFIWEGSRDVLAGVWSLLGPFGLFRGTLGVLGGLGG